MKLKRSAILEEIASVIGLPATLLLTRAFGGQTTRVPVNPKRGTPLVLMIGLPAAQRLAAQFRREYLSVPTEQTLRLQLGAQLAGATVRNSEVPQ